MIGQMEVDVGRFGDRDWGASVQEILGAPLRVEGSERYQLTIWKAALTALWSKPANVSAKHIRNSTAV
jgi:hypothetical protein